MNTTRAIVILAFTLCLAAANAQNVPTGNSTANPRTSAQSQPSDAMADCPLHAQHMAAKDDARHQNVDRRGDQAMGFDHSKTTHHFLQREDGGIIQVTADNAADRESIAAVRGHLAKIAQLFAAGDFNIPMFVHDQVPPGVPQMQKLRAEIRYQYKEIERGGQVVISTANSDAQMAIRAFLSFQIHDHQTGDAMTK